MPLIEMLHMETPSPLNPLGLKGAGEGGTIAADRRDHRRRSRTRSRRSACSINEAPITPARIVELLGEAARERAG